MGICEKNEKSRQEMIYGRFPRNFGGMGYKNGNLYNLEIHYIYNVFACQSKSYAFIFADIFCPIDTFFFSLFFISLFIDPAGQ